MGGLLGDDEQAAACEGGSPAAVSLARGMVGCGEAAHGRESR